MNIRNLCAGSGLAALLSFSVTLWAQGTAPPASKAKAGKASPNAVVNSYCLGCHNDKVKSGNLSLTGIDMAKIGQHAEVGEKIVRKLRSGMMPPAGLPRPDATTYNLLAVNLERQLDLTGAAKPYYPPPGAHRLNRREYANSVRDLLALEIDPATLLPVDDASYGFDNMAGTLGTSPALVEAYVSAAAKVSRAALGHEMNASMRNYLAPADYSQNDHAEGLAFGSRGGMAVRHYFPVDGDYIFDWTPVRANAGGLFGNTPGELLELTLDGERIKVFDVDKEVPRGGGTAADNHETKVHVKAGMRTVGLAFLATTHVPLEDFNKHFERTTLTQNIGGFTFSMHVNSLAVSGPFNGKRPEQTPSRDKIFVCRPKMASEETMCAKTILSALARKAFRRPVNDRDAEALLSQFQAGRNGGDFEDGIQRGLQLILSDPEFVYRTELVPASTKAGGTYLISELELASRLSYFLWSSAPDEELLRLAAQKQLRTPGMLARQVKRMLADPKSKEMISNFAGQWLQLRNLQARAPVGDLFPNFDDNLRQAFKTETEMFFESIVREDRNVVDLLNADYTFVNDRLARHYGIPNIYGSQFRRVQLGQELDMRRGLMGQGSILMVTSIADRTSPVQRGKWVMLNILGVVPPDPPPNVPTLEASVGAQKVTTMRQRMELHRSSPACASCHKMFDPIGFALETFDAVGGYRSTEGGAKLDMTGQLVDGTKFDGPSEMRRAILKYSPRFVQTMTERLFTYGMGRGVEYYDMPVVRRIVKDAAVKNNRFYDLVLGIVQSQPFQRNQAVPETVASN
jgi:hypothetical protein